MSSKNIQIKADNGSTWDDLFPKTKATIVEMANGKSLETYISEILGIISSKATPSDVDAKLKKLIGTAPEALNTLQEIAQALNNNPDFASSITTTLTSKVDKVNGKGLSSEDFTTALKAKLELLKVNEDGTAQTEKYVHPSTHPAKMIVEDTTHKFITESEKNKLKGIETGANKYVHPSNHSATMIVTSDKKNVEEKLEEIESNISSVSSTATGANSKATTATTKADSALSKANSAYEKAVSAQNKASEASTTGTNALNLAKGKTKISVGKTAPSDADIWYQEI